MSAAHRTAYTGDNGDDQSRLGRFGRTARKWAASTRRAITGFPYRRRRSWSQRGTRNELNELLWREARGEYIPNAEERKQELLQDWLDDQEAKVHSWNGDYPGEATEPEWGRIDEVLAPAPPAVSTAFTDRLIPRYIEEDGEFGEPRSRMLNRIDELDMDTYDDPQAVAYRTDDDIRQDLFHGELDRYGHRLPEDDIDELLDYADDLKEDADDGSPEKPEDVARYEQDRIHQHLADTDDFAGDVLRHWVIPNYVNEADTFAGSREQLVDNIVQDYGTQDYDDLTTASDAAVRQQLLRSVITTEYDTALSDGVIDELIFYADNLRAHADIDMAAEQPDTGYGEGHDETGYNGDVRGGSEDDDEDAGEEDPRSDGGTTAAGTAQSRMMDDPVSATVQETDLPAAYTEDGHEIVNAFISTGYNTYQKIDTGEGVEYRKNGAPTTQAAYAGASAHKLPDGT